MEPPLSGPQAFFALTDLDAPSHVAHRGVLHLSVWVHHGLLLFGASSFALLNGV